VIFKGPDWNELEVVHVVGYVKPGKTAHFFSFKTFKGSAWVLNIFVKASLNSRTCANGFKLVDCRFKGKKRYIYILLAFFSK